MKCPACRKESNASSHNLLRHLSSSCSDLKMAQLIAIRWLSTIVASTSMHPRRRRPLFWAVGPSDGQEDFMGWKQNLSGKEITAIAYSFYD